MVLLVLINDQNQVLISKRKKNQTFAGCWEFPGGKVEINESSFDALCRESQEELSYHPTQAKPFTVINHNYKEFKVKLDCWICFDSLANITPNEGQQIRWIEANELQNLNFPKANSSLIQKIIQHIDILN